MNTKSLSIPFAASAVLIAATASAAPGYSGTGSWAASADITNGGGHSGIVVTDSSQAACQLQFANAMASHAAAHGDTFGNIKNCKHLPGSAGGGIHLEEALQELSDAMGELESEFGYQDFLARRDRLLRRYHRRVARQKRALRAELRAQRDPTEEPQPQPQPQDGRAEAEAEASTDR